MKKVEIELSQVGNAIITQSSVKIRVGGQFVKNSLVDIINNSLEIGVKNVKAEVRYYSINQIEVDVSFHNGNAKTFFVDIPLGFIIDNYVYSINTKSADTKNVLQDSLSQIKNNVEEIEKYIMQNHSVCNNYFFSV